MPGNILQYHVIHGVMATEEACDFELESNVNEKFKISTQDILLGNLVLRGCDG